MHSARDRIRLTLPWCALSCVLVIPFGLVAAILWGPLVCKGDIDAISVTILVGLLLATLCLFCHRLDELNSVFADDQHIYVIREGKQFVINWSQVKLCHNMGGIPNVMIITYAYKRSAAHVKAVYFGKAKKLIKKSIELYDITYYGRV